MKMGRVGFINGQVARGETTIHDDLLHEAGRIFNMIHGAAEGVRYVGVSRFGDLFLKGTKSNSLTEADGFNQKRRKAEISGVSCPKERKLKDSSTAIPLKDSSQLISSFKRKRPVFWLN